MNEELREKINGKTQIKLQQGSTFGERLQIRAMQHGVDNEQGARSLFKYWYKSQDGFNEESGDYLLDSSEYTKKSVFSQIDVGEYTSKVIGSPDDVLLYRYQDEQGSAVVEYKCPYPQSTLFQSGRTSIARAYDFKKEYPDGNPKAFIQAACYALMFGARKFYTVHYFTDGVSPDYDSLVIYEYIPSAELYVSIFEAIRFMNYILDNLENDRIKKTSEVKKIRVKSGVRKELTEIMKSCFVKEDLFCFK